MQDTDLLPLAWNFINRNYNATLKPITTNKTVFIHGTEADGLFVMAPGLYVIIVFSQKENDEKRFALVIAAQNGVVRQRG